jgi:hypothetical protein
MPAAGSRQSAAVGSWQRARHSGRGLDNETRKKSVAGGAPQPVRAHEWHKLEVCGLPAGGDGGATRATRTGTWERAERDENEKAKETRTMTSEARQGERARERKRDDDDDDDGDESCVP